MRVQDVMTPDPACATKDTSLTDVARMMQEDDTGVIPVLDKVPDGKLIGMVTDRDIVLRTLANGEDPYQMAAGDIMSAPAVSVSPDDDMEKCLRLMEEHQIRRVPVANQSGRCVGIVSQADLARQNPEQTARVVKKVSEPAGAR